MPIASGIRAAPESVFVVLMSLGVDCPASTIRCCIDGAMRIAVESKISPNELMLSCFEPWVEALKAILKHALEFKSQKDLDPQNQEPGFVQRGL